MFIEMYSFTGFQNDTRFTDFQQQYSREYNSALKTIIPEEIIEDEDFIKNNLKLVFVIGSVFFKEDKDNLDKLLDYFDREQPSYIDLDYEVTNYKDPRVQIVENTYEIDNGNYHILMITTIPTDDPNEKFVCTEFPRHEFKEIMGFIINYHQRYGKIREERPKSLVVNQTSDVAYERKGSNFNLNLEVKQINDFDFNVDDTKTKKKTKVKTKEQRRNCKLFSQIHEDQNRDYFSRPTMAAATDEQDCQSYTASNVSRGYFMRMHARDEIEEEENQTEDRYIGEGVLYYEL